MSLPGWPPVTVIDHRFSVDDRTLWDGEKRRALAAMGSVDEGLMPYLDRLNGLPMLYTVQSCRGHVATDPRAAGGTESGRIWMRFDALAQLLVLGGSVARQMSSRNWCEQAGLLWGREHFPVLEIVWRPAAWREALESICESLGAVEQDATRPAPQPTEATCS